MNIINCNNMSSTQQDLNTFFTQHQPTLSTQFDALALAIHAVFIYRQFDCIGTTEQSTSTATTSTTSNTLPSNWNSTQSSGLYTFTYTHNRLRNKRVLTKVLQISDDSVTVHCAVSNNNNNATSSGNTGSQNFSINISPSDYISDNLANYNNIVTDSVGLITAINNAFIDRFLPAESQKSQDDILRDEEYRGHLPRQPPTTTDDDELGYDPLRIHNPAGTQQPPIRGQFADDLNPFGTGSGGTNRHPTGNLMGPDNFPYGVNRDGSQLDTGRRGGPGSLQPRFDPCMYSI